MFGLRPIQKNGAIQKDLVADNEWSAYKCRCDIFVVWAPFKGLLLTYLICGRHRTEKEQNSLFPIDFTPRRCFIMDYDADNSHALASKMLHRQLPFWRHCKRLFSSRAWRTRWRKQKFTILWVAQRMCLLLNKILTPLNQKFAIGVGLPYDESCRWCVSSRWWRPGSDGSQFDALDWYPSLCKNLTGHRNHR